MNVTPDTTIRLLKCPLELDNKNQITFANETTQRNYFLSLQYLEIDGSMYQRKDSSIWYPGLFDDLIGYNYVMYQNTHYSNKWFYAFILKMEYINDNMTRIVITTDPYQTWQFDITFMQSFVEREMIAPNSDTPGANLVPENLETGEYKVQNTASVSGLEAYYVVAFSDYKITLGSQDYNLYPIVPPIGSYTKNINGIPSAVAYIVTTTRQDFCTLMDFIIEEGNQSEKVVAVFTIPSLAVKIGSGGNTYKFASNWNFYSLNGTATSSTETLSSTPTALDGYTPKNAKVRQYPYLYLGYNPPNGTSKIFRFEDFSSTPSFKLISEVNPNPSVYFIPQNYRGKSGDSLSDNVTLNGYPQLSSKVDVYNSWLAENTGIINVQNRQAQINYELDTLGTAVSMFSGIGGLIGSSVAGAQSGQMDSGMLSGFGSTVDSAIGLGKIQANYDAYVGMVNAQKEKQAMLPDNVTLGGSNATLLGYDLMDDNIFTTYSIKYQFAKRIDDYFSMYGYQTNELKVPNLTNRPKWNYVKTAGANILGNIPQEDLATIKSIFDNGVTLWHDTSHFLDYSQTNK